MSDRMPSNKFRVLVVLVTISFIITGLPSSLSRATSREPGAPSPGIVKASAASTPLAAIAGAPVQASPNFNKLLQDDSSGDIFRFNSTTGDYLYGQCGTGYTLAGTGTVLTKGSVFTLTHNPLDRRITARLDQAVNSGTASIQVFALGATFTITDRNTTNDPALSDASPPQVGITAPNGGEIIDTRSSFSISWNAADDVGVTSQDILLSTDGGTGWSTVASGLAGSVNQYAWTVPLIVNKQTVKVRVVARDAGCNASSDDSDANFTIWNALASFTHQAEAPLFFAGQGFTSSVYLTNTSASAVVIELDPHQASGNATQNFPFQLLLNPGASATVDSASLYTIGVDPENPAFPALIEGGIRLRHNGAQDKDVRAILVAERGCNEQFTTPFTYAASSLSASGTMQCSPMYYVDNATDAYVSFQNATNLPQTVQLTCNYGTGIAGTPGGQFKNQPIVLGPQQTSILNLRSVWSTFGGAEWGSMDVFTSTPQSVVCHSVMMSLAKGIAWDCPFVDPAMSANTTRVAQTVMLDYNNSENAYLMVRNTSPTDSRTVTASFNTNNGPIISPVQVTLAPGAQRMIHPGCAAASQTGKQHGCRCEADVLGQPFGHRRRGLLDVADRGPRRGLEV